MMVSRDIATSWLIIAGAFVWPLGQLGYLPVLQIQLLGVATAALTFAMVVDLAHGEKLRVPFEVLAPSALILVLLSFHALIREEASQMQIGAGVIALGIATSHLARDTALIRRALWATTLSAFFIACLTLIRPITGIMPTAYSLHGDTTLTFARALDEGFFVLALCGAIAAYVAMEKRYQYAQRAIALLTGISIVVLLTSRSIGWLHDTGAFPVEGFRGLSSTRIAILVLAVWLLSRILAKVRASSMDPHLSRLWAALAWIALLFIAVSPVSIELFHGWLPALALASCLPQRVVGWPHPRPYLVGLVLIGISGLNLFWVDTENALDARQYDAAARQDFIQGRFGSVLSRMDRIEAYRPHEARTDLWRSRVALANDHFNWSSFAFRDALKPVEGRLLLPPPTRTEEEDFLVTIRDMLAAVPDTEAICAYERVLLARDDRDAALYSLKVRSGIPLAHSEADLSDSLAEIAAMVVGDETLAEEFRTWEADELLTLLIQWGATVEKSDEPWLLAAQRDLEALHVYARAHGRTVRFEFPLPRSGPRDLEHFGPGSGLYWQRLSPDDRSPLVRYRLNARVKSGIESVGQLIVSPDRAPVFELDPHLPSVPYLPALRFRLPE